MTPSPRADSPPRLLAVSGDVVVDHHIYEGERGAPTVDDRRGVRVVREHGGACCVERLLRALLPEDRWTVALGVTPPPFGAEPCGHDAYATWKPFPERPDASDRVWRAHLVMGYGHEVTGADAAGAYTPRPAALAAPPRVLVLDDAGFVFRHERNRACWQLPAPGEPEPDWIVLKMAAPVGQGELWHALAGRFADRLIAVVSASELRREAVAIARGLSWERSLEDLREALRAHPVLAALTASRHLVVAFSADGAVWLDREAAGAATLVCDMAGAEGEWMRRIAGSAFGQLSCLVAAVAQAAAAAEPGAPAALAPAIAGGLAAMRDLAALGHGAVEAGLPEGFPARRLAGVIRAPAAAFATMRVSWPGTGPGASGPRDGWTIVEESQRPLDAPVRPSLLGLARQVLAQGASAIRRLPHAAFGGLITADRAEIEALRGLRRLMLDYRDRPRADRPVAVGVFGPPGAGKSFGVKQIALGVFGGDAWLEFNLSQFSRIDDLTGAFHQVRDRVLGGVTPVVFWDEFDARDLEWLQYLLAPLQDGRFQQGQLTHAIGKCVCVFAGGTSHTFEEFGRRRPDAEAQRRFELRKGPDFHSRLDAYLDVAGPNRRTVPAPGAPDGRAPDPADVGYPLRRALLFRAHLDRRDAARLDIDSDLMDALLRVPAYLHGARSLEKLAGALRPASAGGAVRRSALPPPHQLAMLVDAAMFQDILGRNTGFRRREIVEALAPAIHETWRALARAEGWTMQPHFDRPWAELAPADQEENRAAARRIPDVLALAGLGLEGPEPAAAAAAAGPDDHAAAIARHLDHHLERLAEAEHDGWMAHRLANGWRHDAARDDARKRHPALVPYAALTETDKGKDRNSVRRYPDMVRLAGCRIVFLRDDV